MSKTNDTSKPATLEDHHMLADSELDAVSGGFFVDIGTTETLDLNARFARSSALRNYGTGVFG